jgi:hypothetical protein
MCNYMKSLFSIVLFLYTLPCLSQDSTRTVFVKEVKWSITMPENFELVEDSAQDNLNKKGAKLMGEANGVDINPSQTKNLFSTHNGNNILYSTITPFDVNKDGSYKKANIQLKEMLYKTFIEKVPKAKVDSSTSTVTIDELVFEKFTIQISLNGRHLITMCVLYKLYRGYDFGVTYLYMNDWAQMAIEKVIFASKFSK